MWIVAIVGIVTIVLAYTAPAPFILEALAGDRALWHMPRDDPPTVYLTYDDGPNPTTTPHLLDVLEAEHATATFFLIDSLVTEETAPLVRRIVAGGHGIGLHSSTRGYLLKSPDALEATLRDSIARIEGLTGTAPCRLFRPHAGWRNGQMYAALERLDYRLVGWSWMLWDWNWFRPRTAGSTAGRVAKRASAGDIIVMHDGDESAPRRAQPQTVEATARLVPTLRDRGFTFGTLCQDGR